jgi:hypothetical protein
MLVSLDGGKSFQRVVAPAQAMVRIGSMREEGLTRYFDTEMLSLRVQGGGLQKGVMIRESPTKASTGRTQIEGGGGAFMISSFFDIFIEVSLDDGATWTPAEGGPATMLLRTAQPTLRASWNGKEGVFAWPDDGLNWKVQFTPVMSERPLWRPYTGPIEQQGGYKFIRVEPSVPMMFYRLCLDCP